MNEFGKRLRIIRKENKMSLLTLSEKLKTSKSLLSRYENGKVDPALGTAIEIAEFFNVSLNWIAGMSDIEADRKILKSSDYEEVFDKCIEQNIAPEKLDKMLDLLKG